MANDNKLVNLADLKAAFDEVNDKAGVVSVNGQTGAVSITPANIGAHPAKTNLQVTNNSNYTGTTESFAPIAQILDSSGYIRHQMYGGYASDGRLLTFLAVRRPNGTLNETNQISVGFDASGNKIYSVSDPAAFRSAIGATDTKVKGNAESSYRTGNVNLTPANIGAAASIKLDSEDTTPSTIYNKINVLSSANREGALIHIHQAALNVLTNRTDFTGTYSGLIIRATTGISRFMLTGGGSTMICFYATITSSTITPGPVYKYSGTPMT